MSSFASDKSQGTVDIQASHHLWCFVTQIEEERRRDIDQSNSRREEFNQREKELSDMNARLQAIADKLEELKAERREGALERRENVKARSSVELGVKEMEESGSECPFLFRSPRLGPKLAAVADSSRKQGRGQDRLAALERELEKIESDITTAEASLMESTPAYEDALARHSTLTRSLETAQTTLNALFAKQGRTSQFSSRDERDEHLNELIERNRDTLDKRRKRAEALVNEVRDATGELDAVGERRKQLRNEMEQRKHDVIDSREQVRKLEDERNDKIEQRK